MLLVTGATGFVGWDLLYRIGKKRSDIRVVARNRRRAEGLYPKHEIVRGDLTKPHTLYGLGKDVDTVIHLAGRVSYSLPRDELFRINVEGTRNLLDKCKEADRIIFASSVSVYGEIRGKADEGYLIKPGTPYAESKLEAENLVRDSGIDHVVLRIAPVYGEGSPQWIKNLRLLEKGFPIPKTGNLTHVVHNSQVARAIESGIKKGSGIYNIANKEPVEFTEFASMLVRELGKEPRTWPYWLVSTLSRFKGMKTYLDVLTMNRHYVTEKAEKELGYEPDEDFVKQVRKMVSWYKKQKTANK